MRNCSFYKEHLSYSPTSLPHFRKLTVPRAFSKSKVWLRSVTFILLNWVLRLSALLEFPIIWFYKESSTSVTHSSHIFRLIIYISEGFPGDTNGKEPACQCRRHVRHGFDPWVGKIPWRRAWQPTQAFLSGESHRQRSLVGYSPQGRKESDTTEVTACTHAYISEIAKFFSMLTGQ